MKVVAVDSGAYSTKAKSSSNQVLFRTKYTKGHMDLGMCNENTYNCTINGKQITIGDSARNEDVTEGKDSELHIWASLTSIALCIEEDTEEIILIYGESFNMYRNKQQKENIKLALEKEHIVTVENQQGEKIERKFTITFVHILPEGVGHILQNLKEYQGVQYVLDWGGSTVNFLEVINGLPSENSRSFELGMHNLTGSVEDAISKAGYGRRPEHLVKSWIENGSPDRAIQSIIDDVIEDQLYKIDHELNKAQLNLQKFHKVVFIGGTSKLFATQIRQRYACAEIYPNCLTANVDGFYTFGRLKYND